jgi:hypothetical protein
MLKNKVLGRKKLFLLMLSLVILFISSAVSAGEIKEIWNHISINNTEFSSIDYKVRSIWEEFEKSSIQRGLVVKPNYQPFVPLISRIIILDTPVGELAIRNYCLRVETEVKNGEDVRITEITLSKIFDERFPEATVEQQTGYANGKLGGKVTYWLGQKKIIPEKLSALEQLKLENFKRSIELDYSGDIDYRRVPVNDVFHFFPEISNDLKLNFEYLYPQNDRPMFKTTYLPGRIRFGSLLDTDVKISFVHNIITAKMVRGDICWKTNLGKFTTGEEFALCESFFYFIQESLAKENLIAPALPALF